MNSLFEKKNIRTQVLWGISWGVYGQKYLNHHESGLISGSKTGKRPLSSSSTPASKVPKCLEDEGKVMAR